MLLELRRKRMFKFFTKRWVSRKEFDEVESELKSVKLEKKELRGKYFKKWCELLNIIEEKEKTIQRLESKPMDDVKAKGIPVQEVNGADVLVLDEKGDIKQILRPEKPKDQEAWIIPFCIEELKKLNKELEDYSPSSPELAGLDVREVVFRLALEMRVQNNVLMTALRHLMGGSDESKNHKA